MADSNPSDCRMQYMLINKAMINFAKHKFIKTPLTEAEEEEIEILCNLSRAAKRGLFDCFGNVSNKHRLLKINNAIKTYKYIMLKLIPLARHANVAEINLWCMYNDLKKLIEYREIKINEKH